MKVIEAMKQIKANKAKIADLQTKIGAHSANLNFETPVYGDKTSQQITEWVQTCTDLSQDNVNLLCAISAANLATKVTIELGGKQVVKSVSAWVWRRREYAAIDAGTYSKLTDRGLKEGNVQSSPGVTTEVRLIRHFDPKLRDEKMDEYRTEASKIDSALEVSNAITDLIEVAA